jgi:ribosomal protein S12 methylthiotransferase
LKTRKDPQRIGIVSLGCAKNLVDTEILLKQLDAGGFTWLMDPDGTVPLDAAIINTCGFILDAKNESIDTILRFAHAKKKGIVGQLFVMGCLSERYREQLTLEMPEVDGFFGVNELKKILERVGGGFRKNLLGDRIITTPGHYSFLKIAEGCNRSCSFCSIPLIRGKHISKPIEQVVAEAASLIRQGVKEINVISQDSTYYGLDLYNQRKLPELLRRLAVLPGIGWIRVLYTYPDGFPERILDVMNEYATICKYVDIPLQHISSRILRSMKRGMDRTRTMQLLDRIREKVPGVAIRTTFITGYPGETEKEFTELKEFVRESMFDRMGVFIYSHEEGTHAFLLKDDVPAKVKQRRAEELMEIQEEISMNLNQAKVGKEMRVIIDRLEGEYYIGRSAMDAPEVDNEVLIPSAKKKLVPGTFQNVLVSSASHFDLYGQIQE